MASDPFMGRVAGPGQSGSSRAKRLPREIHKIQGEICMLRSFCLTMFFLAATHLAAQVRFSFDDGSFQKDGLSVQKIPAADGLEILLDAAGNHEFTLVLEQNRASSQRYPKSAFRLRVGDDLLLVLSTGGKLAWMDNGREVAIDHGFCLPFALHIEDPNSGESVKLTIDVASAGPATAAGAVAGAPGTLGRNTFQDATILYDALARGDEPATVQVFQRYMADVTDIAQIIAKLEEQNVPYLPDLVGSVAFRSEPEPEGMQAFALDPPSEAASGLALPQADLAIKGIAVFLAKRFKEEMRINFFADIVAKIENNRHLKLLFPETVGVIAVLGTAEETWVSYKTHFEALKAAWEKDLENLLTNAAVYLENEALCRCTELNIRYWAIALKTFNAIEAGTHPIQAIDTLSRNALVSPTVTGDRVSPVIRLLAIVARNLVDESGTRLVSPQAFRLMIGNSDLVKTYIGLLYLVEKTEIEAITLGNTSLDAILRNEGKIDDITGSLANLVALADKLENLLKTIKENELDEQGIATLVSATTDFLAAGASFAGEEVPAWADSLAGVQALYEDIRAERYVLALVRAAEMAGLAGEDLRTFLAVSAFITNVAAAESPEEVAKVIDDAALPVGSWRIKRDYTSHVSLNAYVGGFFASETFDEEVDGDKDTTSVAITAPVGLNFSRASKKGSSHSIFIPIIDVGALVDYQFDNDSLESLPETDWDNVFSPGLFYYYGRKNKPYSFGIGLQHGPDARGIKQDDTSATLEEVSSYRIGLTVTVDIAIFDFRKGKKIKRR